MIVRVWRNKTVVDTAVRRRDGRVDVFRRRMLHLTGQLHFQNREKTGTPIKLLFLLGAIRNPPLENNGCPELFFVPCRESRWTSIPILAILSSGSGL
jgi:hypothetical protein